MKKVMFLPWVDPLRTLLEIHEEEADEFREARESFGEVDNRRIPFYSAPTITGPAGAIPLVDGNLPSDNFSFWVCHTNFDVDEAVLNIVNATPGVETLDMVFRYRFRVGIGKLFNNDEVKQNIEKMLCCEPAKMTGFDAVKSKLSRRYKYWAMYLMPSGGYEAVGGTTIEEVKEKGRHFESAANRVVTSWCNS